MLGSRRLGGLEVQERTVLERKTGELDAMSLEDRLQLGSANRMPLMVL